MPLTEELGGENNGPYQYPPRPDIGLGNLEGTTDGKLHQEHQATARTALTMAVTMACPQALRLGFIGFRLFRE